MERSHLWIAVGVVVMAVVWSALMVYDARIGLMAGGAMLGLAAWLVGWRRVMAARPSVDAVPCSAVLQTQAWQLALRDPRNALKQLGNTVAMLGQFCAMNVTLLGTLSFWCLAWFGLCEPALFVDTVRHAAGLAPAQLLETLGRWFQLAGFLTFYSIGVFAVVTGYGFGFFNHYRADVERRLQSQTAQ